MGRYFSISKAWADVKNSNGALSTIGNVALMAGKTVCNTAVFGVTEVAPSMLKKSSEEVLKKSSEKLKDPSLSEADREKYEAVRLKALDGLEKAKEMEEKYRRPKEAD